MEFDVDMFYHLYWKDYRLQPVPDSDKLILDYEWKSRLWIPDTYFRNAINGGMANDVISPSVYFIINNTYDVFMAARLRVKFSCDMKFEKYPFDKQKCFINVTTLSQNINTVRLNWHSFRMTSNVDQPEFFIKFHSINSCLKDYQNLGIHSCLYAMIQMNRNVGNYLIKRFVPSFLIVIMSFIGFWIPPHITPARISLIVTSLLALIAQQIQAELNVSYIYALEVWTIMCIVYVFATLIEYALAISWTQSLDTNNINKKQSFKTNCTIDVISRFIFPFCYILSIISFTVIYYILD
ncbi:glycine receptor subunit alpha-2-like [Oppia nitens]|uniref:glycine receptor subunit alpha-2-like n=1 Tax=Oppia nitens TaxID=1686743 RepID=UPI0023DAC3E8|nr:glycine receptor subunit alpha-2-like [Oppia nitens]